MNALHTIHIWIQHQDTGSLLFLMAATWLVCSYILVRVFSGIQTWWEHRYERKLEREAAIIEAEQIAYLEVKYNTPRLSPDEVRDLELAKWQD